MQPLSKRLSLLAFVFFTAIGLVLTGCGDDDPVSDPGDPGDDPPAVERFVSLADQALDLTAGDTELLIENVTAQSGDTLLVTTDNGDGSFGDESVVGLVSLDEALTDATVRVDVVAGNQTQAAEPTDHAAHISTDGTVGGVEATSETAAIYTVEQFEWTDATFDEPTGTVAVDVFEILYEGNVGESIISIDLHNVENGEVGAFTGISQEDFAVNEEHTDVVIDVLEPRGGNDDSPREEAEIAETAEFFAMAHLGEAGTDDDGERIPSLTPALNTTTDDGGLAPLVGDFAEVAIEGSGADQTFNVDNDGSTAWIVDGEGGNPDLDLEVGERYRFDVSDVDSSFHPLAFLDAAGDELIEQNGDGAFHDDPNVDLVENDNEVIFTLTEDLSDEVATYICTVHSNMEGNVNVGSDSSSGSSGY